LAISDLSAFLLSRVSQSNKSFSILFTAIYRMITKLHGVTVPQYRVVTDSLCACTAISASYSKVPSSILSQETGYSISQSLLIRRGRTRLRHYVTSSEVAGSRPDKVNTFFQFT
jgi:hypothetical protein